MSQPMLGVTLRQATFLRYVCVLAGVIDLVALLAATRWSRRLAVAEVDNLVGVPVMIRLTIGRLLRQVALLRCGTAFPFLGSDAYRKQE